MRIFGWFHRLLNLVRARLRRFRLIAFPPEMPYEFLSREEQAERRHLARLAKEKHMADERLAAMGMSGGSIYIKEAARYFRNCPHLKEDLEGLQRLVENGRINRASSQRNTDSATSQTSKREIVSSRIVGGGALIIRN